MPVRRTVCHGDFAKCEMSGSYARKAWKRLTDAGRDLTDFPALD